MVAMNYMAYMMDCMFGVITHLMTHDLNATYDVEGAVPYPASTGL